MRERALSVGPPPVWSHIPQAKTLELIGHNDSWHAAFIKLAGPHTEIDILNKKRERVSSEGFVRPFVRQYLKFDPVTDLDRAAIHVNNDNFNRTPSGKILEEVDAESDSSIIRQLTWRYWIKGATHRAKPEHAHGAECAYARLDHVPTSILELTRREISTASPITMQFEENERGGTVYCAFRWIGTTEDNEGVWSQFFSAIIP